MGNQSAQGLLGISFGVHRFPLTGPCNPLSSNAAGGPMVFLTFIPVFPKKSIFNCLKNVLFFKILTFVLSSFILDDEL